MRPKLIWGLSVPGYRHPYNNLRHIGPPVFGVAPEAKIILLIDLKMNTGRIVENKIHIHGQKIRQIPVELLFDLLFVPGEKIHGPVQMMKPDGLSLGEINIFLHPPLIAAQLRSGSQQAAVLIC